MYSRCYVRTIIIPTAMQNKIKRNPSGKRVKTQQIMFEDHLEIDIPDYFDSKPVIRYNKTEMSQQSCMLLDNNFGISIKNQFVFVLLHLRSKHNKNPIHIRIPDICVFTDRSAFDVIFSQDGHIRGLKVSDLHRVRLRDVFKFFKGRWSSESVIEQNMACFSRKVHDEPQYAMMSDNELFLACSKIKRDPFFNSLDYLQNKLKSESQQPLKVEYIADSDLDLMKMANESLLGFLEEKQVACDLSEDRYLRYCNQKICQYLNYEHNIRVQTACFHYIRIGEGQYVLNNVTGLKFNNMSQVLKDREKRIEAELDERNKLIIMSPEKYEKYKSMEGRPNIKTFESIMSGKFDRIMRAMKLNSVSENKREQIKNQIAFKKLHPKSKYSYIQVVRSNNFNQVKREIFHLDVRKPITQPSKYVMQFYNQVGRSYTQNSPK